MKKLLSYLLLILALTATSATAAVTPPSSPTPDAYDCGVLTGMAVATNSLQSWHTDRMLTADGWISHWQANWRKAKAYISDLDSVYVHNDRLNDRLQDTKRLINSMPREGSGPVTYWRDMFDNQMRVFMQIHDQVQQIRAQACN